MYERDLIELLLFTALALVTLVLIQTVILKNIIAWHLKRNHPLLWERAGAPTINTVPAEISNILKLLNNDRDELREELDKYYWLILLMYYVDKVTSTLVIFLFILVIIKIIL